MDAGATGGSKFRRSNRDAIGGACFAERWSPQGRRGTQLREMELAPDDPGVFVRCSGMFEMTRECPIFAPWLTAGGPGGVAIKMGSERAAGHPRDMRARHATDEQGVRLYLAQTGLSLTLLRGPNKFPFL